MLFALSALFSVVLAWLLYHYGAELMLMALVLVVSFHVLVGFVLEELADRRHPLVVEELSLVSAAALCSLRCGGFFLPMAEGQLAE